MDDLIGEMRSFIRMVENAAREEISGPTAESMSPVVAAMNKLVEQNKQIIDHNQNVLESLETLNRKIRSGTPVSKLLTGYPGVKLRRKT